MAMVKITNGKSHYVVSKRAFETMFAKKGFRIVGGKVNPVPVTAMETKQEDKNEMGVEEQKEDVNTVPISEMTKQQLAEFAEQHGIDTSGARNVGEARKIVQKAVRESKM